MFRYTHPLSPLAFPSVLLKVLRFALVLFRLIQIGKSSQIAPLAGRVIFLARVQAIFAGFEFTNHIKMGCGKTHVQTLRK
jgi:hypothetical protein